MDNKIKYSIEQRRTQLITILSGMLHSNVGMHRITTAKLAEALDVSEAALYRYFPSKTKMYEALVDHIENALFTRINNVLKIETNTVARIYQIMQTVLDFARKNPGFARVLTGHALMFEDDLLRQRVAKFFDALEIKLINIIQMNKLREGLNFQYDEKTMATLLVLFCEGQFMRYVRTNFNTSNNISFEQQWTVLKYILA